MNNYLKHIVCFINSEIHIYLTEIPKSSASYDFIYYIVDQWMLHLILSDNKALECDKLVITTS